MSSPGLEERRKMKFLGRNRSFSHFMYSGLWGSFSVRKQSRWHKHLNINVSYSQNGEKTGTFFCQ